MTACLLLPVSLGLAKEAYDIALNVFQQSDSRCKK